MGNRHHGSGKRNKKQQHPQQKPQGYSRREVVSLAEWQLFERFKLYQQHLEDAIIDVQENWSVIADQCADAPIEFDQMTDNLGQVVDVMKSILTPNNTNKKRHDIVKKVEVSSNRPPKNNKNKNKMWLAEIIIEDIGDGKL